MWDVFQVGEDLRKVAFPAKKRFVYIAKHIRKGTKALNIGLGNALLEKLLHKKGVEVYCLDPCEEAINRIRECLKLGNRARVGYAQSIPFKSGLFDYVITSEVLEHLDWETW